jgi:SAM-dependent methyltransferase
MAYPFESDMTKSTESIQALYDLRGLAALKQDNLLKNLDLPLHVSAPYVAFELALAEWLRGHTCRDQPAHFLDFCCGTGRYSVKAAKLGMVCSGKDLSMCSIEASKTLAAAVGVEKQCSFEAGDALQALMGSREFTDVFFCSGSLYYFDSQEVTRAAYAALRSQGAFFCIETNGDNALLNLYRRVRQVFDPKRDEQTLRHLLRPKDFDQVAAVFDSSQVLYFDFFTLAGFLLKPVPPLARFYHRVARKLDGFVLNRLGLRRLAFKVLIQGNKS